MPHVVALYRYPLKGFTPEECKALTVLDTGKIAGDRVLGIRFADTQAADDTWSRKTGMLALVNTPGLARLQVGFEEKTVRLCVTLDNAVLFDDVLNPEGRKRLAAPQVRPLGDQDLKRLLQGHACNAAMYRRKDRQSHDKRNARRGETVLQQERSTKGRRPNRQRIGVQVEWQHGENPRGFHGPVRLGLQSGREKHL